MRGQARSGEAVDTGAAKRKPVADLQLMADGLLVFAAGCHPEEPLTIRDLADVMALLPRTKSTLHIRLPKAKDNIRRAKMRAAATRGYEYDPDSDDVSVPRIAKVGDEDD